MTRQIIRDKIMEICEDKFGLDVSVIGPEYDATPVYVKPFHLRPYMHLILALELQREYGIRYTEDQLVQYGLFTVSNMVDTVMESLKAKR